MEKSILNALLRPETYGEDVKKVKLIQTHTSWVFLTGNFAYKIKKPVFFGFLDYTTLEARKFFCEEELRLNSRLSPDMYLAVLPVVKITNGEEEKVSFGGVGEVIDYAVKMKELPQDRLMTELLKQDNISYNTIDEIAKIVANFHKEAETNQRIAQFGSVETIKFNWDENFAQTEEFIGKTLSRATFRFCKKMVDKFILDNFDLFLKRQREGRIRQCHGDLHSKNIFVFDKIYIFDGIEFNQRFSCCDTASEIAFFVMDLDYFDQHHLANFFIDRYLQYTKDYESLALLDFYKCYRAYVRGKVTSFALNDKGISADDKMLAQKTASSYFRLAVNYAQNLFAAPKLIVMVGLPGVGKTYFAQGLAKKINGYHLRTDIIRKELTNLPLDQHHYTGYGTGIYTSDISARTYDEMFARARRYLAFGKTCILDATFSLAKSRTQARTLAKEFKAKFLLVECYCPARVVIKRLKKRARGFDFSDANPLVYQAMQKNFDPVRCSRDVIKVNTAKPLKRYIKKIVQALANGFKRRR